MESKDAASRDRDSFIRDIKQFHEARGTPIRRLPNINGRNVDLFTLYQLVIAKGGWLKVNQRNDWSTILNKLGSFKQCLNAEVALKQIYLRYLDKYEKIHYLGESLDRGVGEDEDDSRLKRYFNRGAAIHPVPQQYNYHQHVVPDSARASGKLSSNIYLPSEYDKLALSLVSPLPNEQDFAINVCALLSGSNNEGKTTSLRLCSHPRLLHYLLAHAAVYNHHSLRQLMEENYKEVRGYSLKYFWSDVLEDKELSILMDEKKQVKRHELDDQEEDEDEEEEHNVSEVDKKLFNVGRSFGTEDFVGQRVLQVAMILRNATFIEDNVSTLASDMTFLRFALLCCGSSWNCLCQLGFDMLSQVASELSLGELAAPVLRVIRHGLQSSDRAIVLACIETLCKLGQREENEDIVLRNIEQKVYERICSFLSLQDIMLLIHTLECLYSLSSLGERACNNIMHVRGAVDQLVALITVEAQSYGPKACILMRVVETVTSAEVEEATVLPPPMAPVPVQPSSVFAAVSQALPLLGSVPTVVPAVSVANMTSMSSLMQVPAAATPALPTPVPVIRAANTQPKVVVTSQPHTLPTILPSQIHTVPTPSTAPSVSVAAPAPIVVQTPLVVTQQENENFATQWLRSTFEGHTTPGRGIEQGEMYKQYLNACSRAGRKAVIAPLHFPQCVRNVFGTGVGPRQVLPATSAGTPEPNASKLSVYEGIQVRVKPPSTSLTQPRVPSSPILKAQLSSSNIAPKKDVKGKVSPLSHMVQSTPSLPQKSPPPAVPEPSTSLIKSLLASKVGDYIGKQKNEKAPLIINTAVAAQVTQRQQLQQHKGHPEMHTLQTQDASLQQKLADVKPQVMQLSTKQGQPQLFQLNQEQLQKPQLVQISHPDGQQQLIQLSASTQQQLLQVCQNAQQAGQPQPIIQIQLKTQDMMQSSENPSLILTQSGQSSQVLQASQQLLPIAPMLQQQLLQQQPTVPQISQQVQHQVLQQPQHQVLQQQSQVQVLQQQPQHQVLQQQPQHQVVQQQQSQNQIIQQQQVVQQQQQNQVIQQQPQQIVQQQQQQILQQQSQQIVQQQPQHQVIQQQPQQSVFQLQQQLQPSHSQSSVIESSTQPLTLTSQVRQLLTDHQTAQQIKQLQQQPRLSNTSLTQSSVIQSQVQTIQAQQVPTIVQPQQTIVQQLPVIQHAQQSFVQESQQSSVIQQSNVQPIFTSVITQTSASTGKQAPFLSRINGIRNFQPQVNVLDDEQNDMTISLLSDENMASSPSSCSNDSESSQRIQLTGGNSIETESLAAALFGSNLNHKLIEAEGSSNSQSSSVATAKESDVILPTCDLKIEKSTNGAFDAMYNGNSNDSETDSLNAMLLQELVGSEEKSDAEGSSFASYLKAKEESAKRGLMLADLLEKTTVDKRESLIVNGALRLCEKEKPAFIEKSVICTNKKISTAKSTIDAATSKPETGLLENKLENKSNFTFPTVSFNQKIALGMKRANEQEVQCNSEIKKPLLNGEAFVKSVNDEDSPDENNAKASSSAANLYAALAADVLGDIDGMDEEEQPVQQTQTQLPSPTQLQQSSQLQSTLQLQLSSQIQSTSQLQPQLQLQSSPPTQPQSQLQQQLQSQPQTQLHSQPQIQLQAQPQLQLQPQTQLQSQPQLQLQLQQQLQPQQQLQSQTQLQSQPQSQLQQQSQQQLQLQSQQSTASPQPNFATISSSNTQTVIEQPQQLYLTAGPSSRQLLVATSPSGQLSNRVSLIGAGGQQYIVTPQTALVQGQPQTVLVTQTAQQHGTGAKTIIILQQSGQKPKISTTPPPVTTSSVKTSTIAPKFDAAKTSFNTSFLHTPVSSTISTASMTSTLPQLAGVLTQTIASMSTTSVVNATSASNGGRKTIKTVPHLQAATTAIRNSSPTPKMNEAAGQFLCEWRSCMRSFKTANEVYLHAVAAHCPMGKDEIQCLWERCDAMKRKRFSLMTHLYDRHCNPEILKMMVVRRKQLSQCGRSEIPPPAAPSPHPGYAPNAALHAIKRHALEFVNPKELQDDNEGPVTKCIRLTSSLILRNLVIYSANGKRHLTSYEPHLASVALSNVESSRTIAQLLFDMNDLNR